MFWEWEGNTAGYRLFRATAERFGMVDGDALGGVGAEVGEGWDDEEEEEEDMEEEEEDLEEEDEDEDEDILDELEQEEAGETRTVDLVLGSAPPEKEVGKDVGKEDGDALATIAETGDDDDAPLRDSDAVDLEKLVKAPEASEKEDVGEKDPPVAEKGTVKTDGKGAE